MAKRITKTPSGSQPTGDASQLDISADGRYVAYVSNAPDIVANDTNNVSDVFVYDDVTGQTKRISVGLNGVQANAASSEVSISGDGRYIVFNSSANNLGFKDKSYFADVFLYDTQTDTLSCISGKKGKAGKYSGSQPVISDDGSTVTFFSSDPKLVKNSKGAGLVSYDVETRAYKKVGEGSNAAISDDGRITAYTKVEFIPIGGGASRGTNQIFVHDAATNQTRAITVDNTGAWGNGQSDYAVTSGDGRFISFTGAATNLGVDDGYPSYDVYLYDVALNKLEAITPNLPGAAQYDNSEVTSISNDGRYILITSDSRMIHPGDFYERPDIFVLDRQTGRIANVSLADDGSLGFRMSGAAEISADGKQIAFLSYEQNRDGPDGYVNAFLVDNPLGQTPITRASASGVITGGNARDLLVGGRGNDILDGGLNADILDGGLGDDTYRVSTLTDYVIEQKNAGTDSVESSAEQYTLNYNVENLTLVGAAVGGSGNKLANVLKGNALDNYLYGDAGNDIIDGGAGADNMVGVDGDDTYFVDNTGDSVSEYGGLAGGYDKVYSSVSVSVPESVEYLELRGNGNISGSGGIYDLEITDLIKGNDGDNTLSGALLLIGGKGNDTYSGVGSIFASSEMVPVEEANGGIDTIIGGSYHDGTYVIPQFIENYVGNRVAVTGNDLDNVMTMTFGSVDGADGNDTLILKGYNNTATGGSGSDIFQIDWVNNTITDFTPGEDKLHIAHLLAEPLTADMFVVGEAALDANDYLRYNSTTGQLFVDTNGSGLGQEYMMVNLDPDLNLTVDDFLIV